jgi:inner membrane protein
MECLIEPWHWFVLGVLLILSELILPAFAALWFGVAAILVGLLYWLFPSMGMAVQVVMWIILSIACTVAWFKFIRPLSTDKTKAGLSREATVGQIGMVIQTNLEHGSVKVRFPMPVLGADEWNCRTLNAVQVGDRVRVVDILGNDLVVQPHSTSHNENEKTVSNV